jgi:hypothetical protein
MYAFFSKMNAQKTMDVEVFLWSVIGGILVAGMSYGAIQYSNDTPTTKQLSRDFLIGAAFTGFLYPLIPESFDDMKNLLTKTAGGLQDGLVKTIVTIPATGVDPGVQVGPANF